MKNAQELNPKVPANPSSKILKASGIFQTVFFTWISHLISYGSKHILEFNSIPQLEKRMQSTNEFKSLSEFIDRQKNTKRAEGMKLAVAMFKTNKSLLLKITIFSILYAALTISSPFMTKLVISYIENPDKQQQEGIILISTIVVIKFIQSFSLALLIYNFDLLGYSLCNNINLCIFNKAMKYPTLCSKKFTTSELINYSEVDAQRIGSIGWTMASIMCFPIEFIVGIYLMYNFIGISFLAGVGVLVLFTVLLFFNGMWQQTTNGQLLEAKDQRMKITNQIFNIIRFIKINAWEKYFFNKLDKSRLFQLKKIRKNNFASINSIILAETSIPFILISIFSLFSYLGNELTASNAFTIILLFNLLQFPIRALPEAITELIAMWVSVKRIEKFLYTEEINISYIEQIQQSDSCVQITDGSFYWELEQKKEDISEKQLKTEQKNVTQIKSLKQQRINQSIQIQNSIKESLLTETETTQQNIKILPISHVNALKRINISIPKNKFTIVLGDIGSGKSSLFYSILGQMKPHPAHKPSILINGSIAFVSQKPWLKSCTLEENILMGNQKNSQKLQEAVKYSCLSHDIAMLEDGLQTMIGEKGINLSGGQKARINLARALYSNRDILLLDDIISAVDAHVGKFIIEETLLNYLAGKSIILVTHASVFAKFADNIIVMKKGQIVLTGTYNQIKDQEIYKQIEKQENQRKKSVEEQEQEQEKLPDVPILKTGISSTKSKQQLKAQKITDKIVQELLLPEDRERGEVTWKTYKIYIKLNGGWVFLISIIAGMVLYTVSSLLSNFQIQRWCEDPSGQYRDLLIFAALSLSSTIFSALKSLILVFASVAQGQKAHKGMIKGLIYASIPQFFDRIPIGRILNRVSKDLRVLDEELEFTVGWVLNFSFILLGLCVICCYASTPFIAIPIVVFLVICYYLKQYFMKAQRQCVRLENISNSPIISTFTETIHGLPTVRAYGLQTKSLQNQFDLVDKNKQLKISRIAMEGWFAQRLAWVSFVINVTALAYSMFSANKNSSMAGLLLAYAFTFDDAIIDFIFSLAHLQQSMISVQRINSFIEVQPEIGYLEYMKDWKMEDEKFEKFIDQGKIEFVQFSLKYRENLPTVLKNLNFTILPKEKIGIVGRTGAGKSTITSAILRIVEASHGRILIDNKDISKIKLRDLRSNMTLIPQDPVLIQGTIRQNLDPTKEHNDQKLTETMKKCCLSALLEERQGLDTKISDSGDNLSIGQKQLICIARAILRETKIILVDQATANIDNKSDNLIQQTIKTCFKESTVITIAHRLKTIINSDRIIVMSEGKIVEFDTPDKLLERKGIFYQLYQQSLNDKKE